VTTQTTLHPLAEQYLKELRRRARVLPRSRRDELLADIEAHLAETAPAGAGEAEARTALDRLGTPDEIVSAEAGAEPLPGRRGAVEWGAIVLLLVGGVLIPVVGWIVGALLLWISRAWTVRDKIWGTLVLPGGLLPAAWLVFAPVTVESCGGSGSGGQSCSGGPTTTQQTINIAFFVVAVVLPVCTAVYLARRARRPLAAR
jgi:hypothetical protein